MAIRFNPTRHGPVRKPITGFSSRAKTAPSAFRPADKRPANHFAPSARNAGSAAAKPGFFARQWSKLAPKWMQSTASWMAKPIGDIGWVNSGLTAAESGSASIATRAAAKVAENGGKGFLNKALAATATKSASFLGACKGVVRGIPIAGVVLSAALELPAIYQGFKEGRGLKQTGKAATVVTATTAGAVAGAAIGAPLFGAGAVVGGIVGGIVGGLVGDVVGGWIFGNNKGDKAIAQEEAQAQAIATQQAMPQAFGTMTMPGQGLASMPPGIFDIHNPTAGLPSIGA